MTAAIVKRLQDAVFEKINALPEHAEATAAVFEKEGVEGVRRFLHERQFELHAALIEEAFKIDPIIGKRLARRLRGQA